jgi:hypothetical protein
MPDWGVIWGNFGVKIGKSKNQTKIKQKSILNFYKLEKSLMVVFISQDEL